MNWEAEISLRVRYAETDQMGVAHHANHLIWFESARSELCRRRGLPYGEMEARGLFLPVVEACVRYRSAARYDEEITVRVRIKERTRRTLRFEYQLDRAGEVLAEGETLQALVGTDSRIRAFPEDIAALLDGALSPMAGRKEPQQPCD